MASPLPWKWPWNLTSDSSIKSPYYSSSSSPFSSPIVYPFITIRRKRTRLTTFSSQPSSRFCRCSALQDSARKRSRKSENRDPQNEVSPPQIKPKERQTLTLKSLFGKRALWRRILFASRKVRSIILLNVITLIYASNIPVLKEVEAIMDPAAFTVVRFATSAIPFIPFVIQARGDVQTRNAGVELGIWVSLGYLLQALGLLTSNAGRASFLAMFTVIVVPLLDGLLGAVIPTHIWFGALMSLFGVGLLESSGSPPCIGDLLNFLSAASFGVHMLRTEHISRKTSKENFLALLGYEVSVVALLSTASYFIVGWLGHSQEFDPSSWTWTIVWNYMMAFPWIPALYTGVFSTGLCLWIEMSAMCDVSATETAIIYGLEPVWGAGFAWFLLGERWGISGWIGAALVLGGSLTVQIFGATLSPPISIKKNVNQMVVSDEQKPLSATPIVVSTREDVHKIFKK